MKLPPELLAVIERETQLALIRRTLQDLNSPEAAPRLNAQVRLREEARNWTELLLAELDRRDEKLNVVRDELDETRQVLRQERLNRNPHYW